MDVAVGNVHEHGLAGTTVGLEVLHDVRTIYSMLF